MTLPPVGRPRALITGASSGIGAAFAERLAHDGYDLILVARRRERLAALAQRLQQNQPVSVDFIEADLTIPAALRAVEQRLAEEHELTLLVNNAGFGGYMPFVSLDPDRAEELIRLQVIAVTRLTRAALPGMIARGQGAIINVSSRLAFSGALPSPPLPRRATYAATKAYINTFSQILANELEGSGVRVQALCPGVVQSEFHEQVGTDPNELEGTGVRVQALCPGVVQTEFHERVGADPNQFPAALVMKPEDVVTASLAGLERGEVICVPALEDHDLLAHIDESQRHLFEQSRIGSLAQRYRA